MPVPESVAPTGNCMSKAAPAAGANERTGVVKDGPDIELCRPTLDQSSQALQVCSYPDCQLNLSFVLSPPCCLYINTGSNRIVAERRFVDAIDRGQITRGSLVE